MKLEDGTNYKFLDFPALPAELEQECLEQVNKNEFFIFDLGKQTWEGQMILNGQPVYRKQCIFEVFDAPKSVKEWIFDNKIVTDLDTRIGVQRSHGGNALLPHTDRPKNYNIELSNLKNVANGRQVAWNYLLSEPGPVTCFYGSLDINSLIESVILPKSSWHELNVSNIHGVENITSERISLSISLN